MSDNSNSVQLPIYLDAESLVKGLTTIRNEFERLRNDIVTGNRQIKDSFEQIGAAAPTKEMSSLFKLLDSQQQTIQKLSDELENFKKVNSEAFDSTQVKELQAKIAELQKQLADLKIGTKGSTDNLKTDFVSAGRSADELKTKVASLKVAQAELRQELSNGRKAIRDNETEVKKLVDQWGAMIAKSPELQKAHDELIQKGEALKKGLIDTQKRYEDNRISITSYNKELNNLGKGTDDAIQKSSKLSKAFGAIWSGLRTAANILPGFGISGLLLLLIDPITEVIKRFTDLSEAEKVNKAVSEDLKKVYLEASIAAEQQKIKVEQLLAVAQDETRNLEERKAAVTVINELDKEHLGNIKLENIYTTETLNAIQTYILWLDKKARAQAYVSTIQNLYNQLLQEESKDLSENITWYEKLWNAIRAGGNLSKTIVNDAETAVANRNKNVKAIRDEIALVEQKMMADLKSGNIELDLNKEIEANRKKAASDKKKAEEDEEARLRRIAELQKQLLELQLQLLDSGRSKDIATENARYQAAINSLEVLKKLHKTSAEEIKLINELIELQQKVHYKKLKDIDDKYFTDAYKAFKDAEDSISDVLLKGKDKELNDVENKYLKLFETIKITAQKISTSIDNPLAQSGLLVQLAAQQKALEEQKAKDINKIVLKYKLEQLNKNEELDKAAADLITVSGIHEERLTTLKEATKLQVVIEYAKKKLELLKASGDNENEVQIAQLEALIQGAEKKVEVLKKKYQQKDLFEILGFSQEQEDKIKERAAAISKFGETAKNALQPFIDLMDAQINKRKELIDTIQQSIDKQQEAVDREKELLDKGYANNYQMEQKRLADLQKQKDAELEQEKKLQKEKAALQKAQILADTISQTSNLITAASEIYEVMSALGPVGVGLAAASIGIMLTGFIASKVAAFKAVSNGPKFEKGGGLLLSGASHKEGGIKLVDSKTGDVKGEAQGNEYGYFFKDGSKVQRKYEPLLDAINKDELSSWTFNDLKNFVNPVNIEFDKSKVSHLLPNSQTQVTVIQQPLSNDYLKEIAATNKDIATTNRKLLEQEQEKESWTELSDRIIYKKGNMQRIIRKAKEDGAS